MAGFPRISKSPCASKENRFPKLYLPTVYQRNRRAKLAVNTQTPDQVDSTIRQVFLCVILLQYLIKHIINRLFVSYNAFTATSSI